MKKYGIKHITYTALICLVVVSIVAQVLIFSVMSVLNNQKKEEVSNAVATYIKAYVEQKIDVTENILQKFYGDSDVLDMENKILYTCVIQTVLMTSRKLKLSPKNQLKINPKLSSTN